MTSTSSKFLPFFATLIVLGALATEAFYGVDVNLETAIPFLMAIGLGGAGLKAVERAAQARKEIPKDIQDLIKSEIAKIKHD